MNAHMCPSYNIQAICTLSIYIHLNKTKNYSMRVVLNEEVKLPYKENLIGKAFANHIIDVPIFHVQFILI
jgi:hypothetical protein